MNAYSYDSTTGEYLGAVTCQPSPLEEGQFLIPAHATTVQPTGSLSENEVARWTGSQWETVSDYRGQTAYLKTNSINRIIVKDIGTGFTTLYTLVAPPNDTTEYSFADGVWTAIAKTKQDMFDSYRVAVNNKINTYCVIFGYESADCLNKYLYETVNDQIVVNDQVQKLLDYNNRVWVAVRNYISSAEGTPTVAQIEGVVDNVAKPSMGIQPGAMMPDTIIFS